MLTIQSRQNTRPGLSTKLVIVKKEVAIYKILPTISLIAEQQMEVDVNAFVDILGFAAQRRRQATMIIHAYEKISGKTIEHAMKSKMCGAVLNGLLTIGMLLLRQISSIFYRYCYFLSENSLQPTSLLR